MLLANLFAIALFLISARARAAPPKSYDATQYLANQRHDGFLSLPAHSNFLPQLNNSQPKWKLMTNSTFNCGSSALILVKSTVYCSSANIVYAIDGLTGDIKWQYLIIGETSLRYISYVGAVKEASTGGAIAATDGTSFVLLDAANGRFLKAKVSGSTYTLGQIATTTSDARTFAVSSAFSSSSYLYEYDINDDSIKSASIYLGTSGTITGATICGSSEEIIVVSGACGSTAAYKASTTTSFLTRLWTHTQSCQASSTSFLPVCYKVKSSASPRVVSFTSSTTRVCNVFDVNGNGTILTSFPCLGLPLFHYDEEGNADYAVLASSSSQIVVTKVMGDVIIAEEVWFGPGSVTNAYIVGDYLLTNLYGVFYVYEIATGKVVTRLTSSSSYSGFVVGEVSARDYGIIFTGFSGLVAYVF